MFIFCWTPIFGALIVFGIFLASNILSPQTGSLPGDDLENTNTTKAHKASSTLAESETRLLHRSGPHSQRIRQWNPNHHVVDKSKRLTRPNKQKKWWHWGKYHGN